MLLKEIKNIKSTTKELREFGYVVGGAILVFSGIRAWRHGDVAWIWPSVGVGLILIGLLFPAVLKPLQKIWMGLALMMGWVMSRVILTLIFILLVTPIGLILKVQGKQFMDKGADAQTNSFWKIRAQGSDDPRRCERQF